MRIAIAHLRQRLYTRRYNPEKTLSIVTEAKRRGAHIVLMSPLLSVEDLIVKCPQSRVKSILRSYAGRIPSPVVSPLQDSALFNSVTVIASGILERAGPKLFISTVIIGPDGTISERARYRKIAISAREAAAGISPGRTLTMISVRGLNVGFLIDEDILVPELARMLAVKGAHIIVYSVKKSSLSDRKKLRSIAVCRALENNVGVIVVGGIVEHHGDVMYMVPSMAISPQGEVRTEVSDEDLAVIEYGEDEYGWSWSMSKLSVRVLSKLCKDLSREYKLASQ